MIRRSGFETLSNRCVRQVVSQSSGHEQDFETLPSCLKDQIILLMSKRGLLTDSNIGYLLHNKVHYLDLSESNMSDYGLCLIASQCPNLRKLDLNAVKESKTAITSQGVKEIAQGCRYLQILYMRRCMNVDDDAVVMVARCCPHLRELNMGGCKLVSDVALQALGEHCPLLSCLNISQANITDDGIYKLVNGECKNSLQELHMDKCKRLTDDAVEAVVQLCPSIRILIFHGCPNITERSRDALEAVSLGTQMRQVTWTVY